MKKLMSIFLLTFSLLAKPLSWQKVELQNQIKTQVKDSLSGILDQKLYLIEVNIDLEDFDTEAPEFKEDSKGRSQKVEIRKDFNKKEFSKKILFDRVGLLAPEIGGAQDNEKIQLLKYQAKTNRDLLKKSDLFTYIKTVKVSLLFDKSVSDKTKEKAKKLIESLSFGLTEIKIERSYEVGELIVPLSEDEKTALQMRSFLTDFKEVLGPVLSTIIVAICALMLFFLYKSFRKKHDFELLESQNTGNSDEASEAIDQAIDPNMAPGSSELTQAIEDIGNGVGRFDLYLEKSYSECLLVLKRWISLKNEISKCALVLLAERLSVESLTKLFEGINQGETDYWKGLILSRELSKSEKQRADLFISQQIIDDLMTTSPINDEELSSQLAQLTPEQGIKLIELDIELGALLFNLMNPDFICAMMKQIDEERLNAIGESALGYDENTMKDKILLLKEKLSEVLMENNLSYFERKIDQVMSHLAPGQENVILDSLIKGQKYSTIHQVLSSLFPERLIFELDAQSLKIILQSLSKEQRYLSLLSMSEDKRMELINKVYPEGSKAREMIEFDIKNIQENENQMQVIQKSQESIYASFITHAREQIQSNDRVSNNALEVKTTWISQIEGSTTSRQDKVDLKEAA